MSGDRGTARCTGNGLLLGRAQSNSRDYHGSAATGFDRQARYPALELHCLGTVYVRWRSGFSGAPRVQSLGRVGGTDRLARMAGSTPLARITVVLDFGG